MTAGSLHLVNGKMDKAQQAYRSTIHLINQGIITHPPDAHHESLSTAVVIKTEEKSDDENPRFDFSVFTTHAPIIKTEKKSDDESLNVDQNLLSASVESEMNLNTLLPILQAFLCIASDNNTQMLNKDAATIYAKIYPLIFSLDNIKSEFHQKQQTDKASDEFKLRIITVIKAFEEFRFFPQQKDPDDFFTAFILQSYLLLNNIFMLRNEAPISLQGKISVIYFKLAEQLNHQAVDNQALIVDRLYLLESKRLSVTTEKLAKLFACIHYLSLCQFFMNRYEKATDTHEKIDLYGEAVAALDEAFKCLSIYYLKFNRLLQLLAQHLPDLPLPDRHQKDEMHFKSLVNQLLKLVSIIDEVKHRYNPYTSSLSEREYMDRMYAYRMSANDKIQAILLRINKNIEFKQESVHGSDDYQPNPGLPLADLFPECDELGIRSFCLDASGESDFDDNNEDADSLSQFGLFNAANVSRKRKSAMKELSAKGSSEGETSSEESSAQHGSFSSENALKQRR